MRLVYADFFCWNTCLLEELTAGEEVAEPEGGAVAEPVPQLRVPAVDQELNLHVVQHVQLEPEIQSELA